MRLPPGVRPEPASPGQESVWEYPRPPRLEPSSAHLLVVLGGVVVVDTRRALRVLETSHPPTYYLPLADAAEGSFRPAEGTSWCEWKGQAVYLDVVGGSTKAAGSAWTYPTPSPAYAELGDHVALYPGRMDRCTVDGETVRPQVGGFYGGWVTDAVVGPFKGGPGSAGW